MLPILLYQTNLLMLPPTPHPPISLRTLIPCRHISIKPLESHNFQIRLSSRNGTRRIKENWVRYWIHATLSQEEMGVMCSGNFCPYCTNKAVGIAVKRNCLQRIRIKWIFFSYQNSYLVSFYKWEIGFRRKLYSWSESFAIICCTQPYPKNPTDKNLEKSIWFWIVSRLACHASGCKMQIFILKLPISHFDLTY